jgi:hypothetical protein
VISWTLRRRWYRAELCRCGKKRYYENKQSPGQVYNFDQPRENSDWENFSIPSE